MVSSVLDEGSTFAFTVPYGVPLGTGGDLATADDPPTSRCRLEPAAPVVAAVG